MDSKIGFQMSLIDVEAIRGRCTSSMILPATFSEIFGGQTNSYLSSIDIDYLSLYSLIVKLCSFLCMLCRPCVP